MADLDLRVRPRRLRRTPALRALVRETRLDPAQLVLPVFVQEGLEGRTPIASMPGVERHGVASAVALAREASAAGVGGVMLFGIPREKDATGSGAADPRGAVQQAAAGIRGSVDGLSVGTDLCLCEYTDHGHCGPLDDHGQVVNDATVELLVRAAGSQADAGAEVLYPSDMMDGRIGAIRDGLDAAGHHDVVIVAHSAKLATAFFGPFREAAGSAPSSGDRRGHQMDPSNGREALREARLDVAEGADLVMVKPAGPALDLIAAVRADDAVRVPVAAYQVSGEYAMLEAAAAQGWLDRGPCVLESLTAIRRAGADVVATYWATEVAGWLQT